MENDKFLTNMFTVFKTNSKIRKRIILIFCSCFILTLPITFSSPIGLLPFLICSILIILFFSGIVEATLDLYLDEEEDREFIQEDLNYDDLIIPDTPESVINKDKNNEFFDKLKDDEFKGGYIMNVENNKFPIFSILFYSLLGSITTVLLLSSYFTPIYFWLTSIIFLWGVSLYGQKLYKEYRKNKTPKKVLYEETKKDSNNKKLILSNDEEDKWKKMLDSFEEEK